MAQTKHKTGAAASAILAANAQPTEVGALAALAAAAQDKVQIVKVGERTFLAVPEGLDTKEVTDPYGLVDEAPSRIKQSVELLDKDSLVAYVKRHRTDETLIFADPFDDTFRAQIDWHGADEAGFIDHRAKLNLQRSEEWKRWTTISGKLMPQEEFARFLEENAADVSHPAGADLLEVARDLSAKTNVNWKSSVRLDNGDQGFEYSEETEVHSKSAQGTLNVPRSFKLRIPVYMNEPSVEIGAFLRWRLLKGEGLMFGIELHRPVFVQQAVFKQIGIEIADRAEREVITGRIGAGADVAKV